jgi:DeoR family transcriptional regulator, aga operon transcriptional repressor
MNEYQRKIIAQLIQNENMGVKELSKVLNVSDSTTRRQLTLLEEHGLVFRTHGGARMATPVTYESPFENRAAQAVEAKRIIAAAAMSLVSPGLVIGISGGSTCTEFARQLRTADAITVVTNAINVALEIKSQASRRIMVTGGLLSQYSYELVGNQVSQSLQSVHMDIAFLGASGISVDFGFSMMDEPEAMVGQAFMSTADRVIVLADHTKIGKSTFARLCSIKDIDLLITDDQITPPQLESLQKAGLKVSIASSEAGLLTPAS